MTTDGARVRPIDVWCAYCGAQAGDRCRRKSGMPADTPHEARIERALADTIRRMP